jgi:anti-sigma regulatory factor (Ser/Thr protein kinase)
MELTYDRARDSVGQARRAVADWLSPRVDPEELDRVKLLVSELVTNAVLHGQGDIRVRADVNEDRVLVEVIDEGQGFEHDLRSHDFDTVGGRGLMIVDAEASRWGVHEGTTHVWFELERAGPRLGPEQNPLS